MTTAADQRRLRSIDGRIVRIREQMEAMAADLRAIETLVKARLAEQEEGS